MAAQIYGVAGVYRQITFLGPRAILMWIGMRNHLHMTFVQSPKKWLVRGLVKFALGVARLVCPNVLG